MDKIESIYKKYNRQAAQKLLQLARSEGLQVTSNKVRLAAAVPEGHCGGYGTSSWMWCGTLKRLGTRPRWTRQPRAPAAGVQLEEHDSDLSAPTGRLGCRRGSPQSPRREAPSRAGICSVSPRAGPPATSEAPLARRTAAPPLTDLLKWTVRQFGG